MMYIVLLNGNIYTPEAFTLRRTQTHALAYDFESWKESDSPDTIYFLTGPHRDGFRTRFVEIPERTSHEIEIRLYIWEHTIRKREQFIDGVSYSLPIVSTSQTGKINHLPIVCTARPCTQTVLILLLLMGMFPMAAAAGRFFMLRMNVVTCRTADDSSDESLAAAAACMHIKPYDTQRVPYKHERRDTICDHILHITRKDTKFLSIIIISIFSSIFA
jgi:hypothetical protein